MASSQHYQPHVAVRASASWWPLGLMSRTSRSMTGSFPRPRALVCCLLMLTISIRHCNVYVIPPWTIHSGTWRTHRLATEDNFLSVPNDIPVEYAATLAVNPATAHLLLTNFAKLKAGTFFSQQLFCFLLAGKIPYILSLAGTPNTHSKQQVVDVFVLTTLFPQVMLLCKTAPTVA
jgi:hypothetical protein